MNQCLRIVFTAKYKLEPLYEFVKKHAQQYDLEGIVQTVEGSNIRIIVCGERDNIEDFLEALHKNAAEKKMEQIEIEPFLKDRDYRGVFRVIE